MSALSDDTAETLLIEYLKGCTGSYEVAWPNARFTPTIGTAYYRAAFIYPSSERLTHGNTSRHRGIFQVDAVTPAGIGNVTALTMARTVTSYFDNKKIEGSGLSVEIIKPPALGPEIQGNGWYIIPVRIFYTILN